MTKSGPELDALIADKVMGKAMPYSTDVSAAWEVVEKFSTLLKFQVSIEKNADNQWRAIFFRTHMYCEYADTAPLAICLAALKAIGVKI